MSQKAPRYETPLSILATEVVVLPRREGDSLLQRFNPWKPVNLGEVTGPDKVKLLVARLERASSRRRFNQRHQPQMGEPGSNGWSGLPGESPRPMHTICVLCQYYITYFMICQVLI